MSTAPAALTHADDHGRVRMVDVSAKAITARSAQATGRVRLSPEAADCLRRGALPKGDGLAVARVAGIMGVKRTSQMIPLCHPITVDGVAVDLEVGSEAVLITVTVSSIGRTGAEMEALTGVTAAALTVIDMVKAVDHQAVIEDVHVTAKSGGRSGAWVVDSEPEPACAAGHVSRAGLPMGVLVVSDRRFVGSAVDETGPILVQSLKDVGAGQVLSTIVPDDEPAIRKAVTGMAAQGCRVIVTTGGTGVGPRDRTPEALKPLIKQELPGVAQALTAQATNPLAALSRQFAGVIAPDLTQGIERPVFLVALPGSIAAVSDAMLVLTALLPHLIAQLDGGDHDRIPSPMIGAKQ
ncbi:MAG: bifunctional molybdenum cofactor biosynthesis protein MoaC/MoaB [Propionibacteriaceae bacterium]|nr:bifunctional molybdenum cofactor biosynthesis protein MoaC/MoaB [Propionibacteriaceae bacterium]